MHYHQDTALPVETPVYADGWGANSVKKGVIYCHAPTEFLSQILAIRINLDTSTSSNGPLKVIPNSHHRRLETDDEFAGYLSKGQQVECTTEIGGVIAMSPLLLHASSKSLSEMPRRVLHIEYALSLDAGDGIRLAIS